jgi:predicted nucleic acid-binding protein
MIALDTSSLVAYWSGDHGWDVEAIDQALSQRAAALPPPVLTEMLSDPKLAPERGELLARLPVLPLVDGYWVRAGRLRATVLTGGRRARLSDALIAQSCLDHDVELITRDADFRIFAQKGGLRLAKS